MNLKQTVISLKKSMTAAATKLWSIIRKFLKKYMIEEVVRLWSMIRKLLKRSAAAIKTGVNAPVRLYKENPGVLILAVVSSSVGSVVYIILPATISSEMSESITDGLSALITLNAIVLALVYTTMQRAVVLSLRGDKHADFFGWTAMMTVMSMLGVLSGVIYLVWQPGRWMLSVAAACLVVAPGLVPVVAMQELIAQRRRTASAVDKLLAEKSESRSKKTRNAGDARFLPVRAAEFEANPRDPFAGDVLGRCRVVEAAGRVVSDISSPAVLLVEGGWGSGKTAFARMCAALLRSESFARWDGAVVEFNAWTQSHTRVPSQDLILALTSEIHGDNDMREMLLNMVLEAQAIKVAGGEIDAVQLAKYETKTETARFKSLLAEFVASSGGRVAVFIDELDRCRPDHALQVLETVRNLLDVTGVVVVVTVNLDALEHAVKSLLGSDCDVDTYLRRFIDLRMALPRPQSRDIHRFYEHLLTRTGLAERFKSRDECSISILWALAAVHPNSLRDLEQAVHRAAVLLASIEPADGNSSETASALEQIALTLLVLREANREAYKEFVIRGGSGCRAIDDLADSLPLAGQETDSMNPELASKRPAVPFTVLRRMQALILTVSQDSRNGNLHICGRHNDREEHWRYVEKHFNAIRKIIDGNQVDLQELADLIG